MANFYLGSVQEIRLDLMPVVYIGDIGEKSKFVDSVKKVYDRRIRVDTWFFRASAPMS